MKHIGALYERLLILWMGATIGVLEQASKSHHDWPFVAAVVFSVVAIGLIMYDVYKEG